MASGGFGLGGIRGKWG